MPWSVAARIVRVGARATPTPGNRLLVFEYPVRAASLHRERRGPAGLPRADPGGRAPTGTDLGCRVSASRPWCDRDGARQDLAWLIEDWVLQCWEALLDELVDALSPAEFRR